MASEYRHIRSGSLSIPQHPSPMNPHAQQQHQSSRFEGPRSPPNTSHVPCKFFRQGACQAGSACPFSHDVGAASETVCKYFAKGNCKFGPKCANIHVLADGRRINYGKNGITIGQPLHLGNRMNPQSPYTTSNSALTDSFMRADATAPYGTNYGYPMSPGTKFHQLDRQPSLENGLPTIDTTYSHTSSQYGSPHEEDPSRLGLGGLSPMAGRGLSVLDAPLPASFDSNGISNAARFPAGPWPSSVPSQFGVDSPSPSLNAAKELRSIDAVKLLHSQAYPINEPSSAMTASSPPTQASDEYFGRRPMHSSRYAKPKLPLSSSAPRTMGIDRDWEPEFPFLEEDYVPDNLQDLLTPAEKARRGSRAAEDQANGHKAVINRSATPSAETTSKLGSPMAASPSRWGSLFMRQKEEEDAKKHALASSGAFGHVGSPLRNSILTSEVIRRPQTGSRSGSTEEGTSALTQQLQRIRIDSNGGESPLLHPNTSAGPITHIGIGGRPTNARATERHISSGSFGSSTRFTTPIGEDDGEFVFSMDEDGDRDTTIRARKRTSGVGTAMSLWNNNSYSAVTSGGGVNGKKDSVGVVEGVGGR